MSDINPATRNRFTLMIREVRSEDGKTVVKGLAFGKPGEGETLYLQRSSVKTTVLENVALKEAGDLTEISFTNSGLPENLKYGVITNVDPEIKDMKTPVENPFLLGVSREYKDFYKELEYTNELCYNIVHGRYLVAVYSKELTKDGNVAPKGAQLAFPMLTVKDDIKVLPVFTDFGAFSKWKGILDEKNMPKILVTSFENAAEVGTKDKDNDGFVINFTEAPVPVPAKLIADILASDGYKHEKGLDDKSREASVAAPSAPSKSNVVIINKPSDSSEITKASEVLKEIGAADKNIREIYLLEKRDETDSTLLLIFDLDFTVTEEERSGIYAKASEALKGILGSRNIELAMKAPLYIKTCAAHDPVYKA